MPESNERIDLAEEVRKARNDRLYSTHELTNVYHDYQIQKAIARVQSATLLEVGYGLLSTLSECSLTLERIALALEAGK